MLVTHHLDEISTATISRAVLLRGGRVVDAGPVGDAVTGALVSATFDVPVEVEHRRGRVSAHRVP